MIDSAKADEADDDANQIAITPVDAAAYIVELSGELASIAGAQGLGKVAAALELAQTLACEALAAAQMHQAGSGNAAPGDAA